VQFGGPGGHDEEIRRLEAAAGGSWSRYADESEDQPIARSKTAALALARPANCAVVLMVAA